MKNSKLYQLLSALSQSSIESVQTGNGFSEIDSYLHTERPITDELLNRMIEINEAGGGIILLVGSAGDGKSHLLSKIKDSKLVEWGEDSFYNDATASCSPNKTAVETLKEGLVDFMDENIYKTNKRKILAINLGKLNAFIDDEEIRGKYGEIVKATEPLFDEDDSTPPLQSERVKVVEFSNKQLFEIYPEKKDFEAVDSAFLSAILEKLVVSEHSGKINPFYAAFQEDLKNNINLKDPVVLNYKLLTLPEVRRTIVLTVIEAIICFKLVITPREFLDFIYSILIPKDLNSYIEKNDFYDVLLPTLLYAGGNNSILNAISKFDPMKHSSTGHNQDLSILFTSNDVPKEFLPSLTSKGKLPEELLSRIRKFYANNGRDIEKTTKFLFRLKHILGYHSHSKTYESFLSVLKGVFRNDSNKMMEVYNLVTTTLPRHNGSYFQKNDCIPLNIQGGKYKLFAHLQMIPIEPQYFFNLKKSWEFYPRFKLRWEIPSNGEVFLMMDYYLYSYLYDLNEGKLAITYENEKNIEFSHFLRVLASKSDCSRLLTVVKTGVQDLTLKQTFNSVQLQ